jgi:hypothetical protein
MPEKSGMAVAGTADCPNAGAAATDRTDTSKRIFRIRAMLSSPGRRWALQRYTLCVWRETSAITGFDDEPGPLASARASLLRRLLQLQNKDPDSIGYKVTRLILLYFFDFSAPRISYTICNMEAKSTRTGDGSSDR